MAECVATTSTCAAKPKRNRTVLSIAESRQSCHHKAARVIVERCGVAKKNRDKILRFKPEMCNMGMNKTAKVRNLEILP